MGIVDLGMRGFIIYRGKGGGIRRDEREESLKKTAFSVDKVLDSRAVPFAFRLKRFFKDHQYLDPFPLTDGGRGIIMN